MATRRFGLIVLLSSISLVFLAATTAHAEPLSVESLPETTGPEPQQDPAIAEAVELFKQRDFDGARQAFEKAAKENSDLPPAEIMMAQLFSQINQGAAVRRSLEQAVANSPKDPEAYVIMGEIAVGQGRITEAALLLNEAASLLEGFDRSESRKKILQIRTQAGLAAVAQARDDWKEAEKHLGAWLKLDPENVTALQRMARAKFQNKQAAEALKLLRQAAEGNEDVLTPEIQLARFYQEYGDKKNARIWIEQGLKAAPKDIPTRLVAAQWYLENGQIQEAAEQADAALRIDPKSREALIFRGVVGLFQKNYEQAAQFFQQAHLQSPRDFQASNNLALALVEQDDPLKKRRALEYAQANVQQNQQSADALTTYGWVQFKLGNIDEAEKALRMAGSAGPLRPDTAYYMAEVANAKGRTEEAVSLLEAALRADAPFINREEAQELLKKLKS